MRFDDEILKFFIGKPVEVVIELLKKQKIKVVIEENYKKRFENADKLVAQAKMFSKDTIKLVVGEFYRKP